MKNDAEISSALLFLIVWLNSCPNVSISMLIFSCAYTKTKYKKNLSLPLQLHAHYSYRVQTFIWFQISHRKDFFSFSINHQFAFGAPPPQKKECGRAYMVNFLIGEIAKSPFTYTYIVTNERLFFLFHRCRTNGPHDEYFVRGRLPQWSWWQQEEAQEEKEEDFRNRAK